MKRNTIDYIALGKQVRRHRKSKVISQTELAERVKISPQHLSHIETGRTRASLPVVVEIANALERPGTPINKRYVGRRVCTSNSQQAFSTPSVCNAYSFNSA